MKSNTRIIHVLIWFQLDSALTRDLLLDVVILSFLRNGSLECDGGVLVEQRSGVKEA